MVVHELAPEFWGRVSGPLAALSGSSSKAPGFAGGYLLTPVNIFPSLEENEDASCATFDMPRHSGS